MPHQGRDPSSVLVAPAKALGQPLRECGVLWRQWLQAEPTAACSLSFLRAPLLSSHSVLGPFPCSPGKGALGLRPALLSASPMSHQLQAGGGSSLGEEERVYGFLRGGLPPSPWWSHSQDGPVVWSVQEGQGVLVAVGHSLSASHPAHGGHSHMWCVSLRLGCLGGGWPVWLAEGSFSSQTGLSVARKPRESHTSDTSQPSQQLFSTWPHH